MPDVHDGPTSKLFTPLPVQGNVALTELAAVGVSEKMALASEYAPTGSCTGWGIPFEIRDVVVLTDRSLSIKLPHTRATWLVFMHTSDLRPNEPGPGGFISPMRGEGQLGEHAADYVILYTDGTEERVKVRRRFHLGAIQRSWGENCFEAVAHHKPYPRPVTYEQDKAGQFVLHLTDKTASAGQSGQEIRGCHFVQLVFQVLALGNVLDCTQ